MLLNINEKLENFSIKVASNSMKMVASADQVLKKGRKIFIYGSYGAGNLGDEAILSQVSLQINSLNSKHKKVIISKKPALIYQTHKLPSIHSFLFSNMTSFLTRGVNSENVFLMGGGGLLKDYGEDSSSLIKSLKIAQLAMEKGCKSMLYSVGVEKIRFEESKEYLKFLLDKFDSLTVRDLSSLERLRSIGIRNKIIVTGDPGALLFSNLKKKKVYNFPVFLVSLRHWFEKGFFSNDERVFKSFISEFSKVLTLSIKRFNAHLIFLPFRRVWYDDDLLVINKIIEKMGVKKNIYVYNKVPSFVEMSRILSFVDLTIGMRLHSNIFSFSSLTPMIAISYAEKVNDFMNYIGMGDFCKGISDFDNKEMLELIEYMLKNREELKMKLSSRLKSYVKKLNQNIVVLESLL